MPRAPPGFARKVREKVVLFGSYAHGRPTLDSDVDLLVVMESDEPLLPRVRRLRAAASVPFLPLDIIVATPAEVRERAMRYPDRAGAARARLGAGGVPVAARATGKGDEAGMSVKEEVLSLVERLSEDDLRLAKRVLEGLAMPAQAVTPPPGETPEERRARVHSLMGIARHSRFTSEDLMREKRGEVEREETRHHRLFPGAA